MNLEIKPKSDLHALPTILRQKFEVAYEFPVYFLRNLFSPETGALMDAIARREPEKRHRCIVFLDDGLAKARPELPGQIQAYFNGNARTLELWDKVNLVPGGETVKRSTEHLDEISRLISDAGMDRHSFVIAIGGGAVLDAVGFATAISHRGIRHIRVPATVLSQNDSGVGVKNAVNAFGQKNYFGTFAPPWAVLNDLDLLTSLPDRERRAGISEAIKVALIRDREFFEWIETNLEPLYSFDRDAEEYMIRRCAQLHMNQIGRGGDPFETGSSRPLDFGHWVAHRLEAMTDNALGHGEAVAIGLAVDTRYSVLANMLPAGDEHRVLRVIEGLGLPTWHPMLEQRVQGSLSVLEGLEHFRAHLGGALTITLLSSIGVGHDVHEMDVRKVEEAIGWLKSRAA
jgi:3-dehydroquinate synthase